MRLTLFSGWAMGGLQPALPWTLRKLTLSVHNMPGRREIRREKSRNSSPLCSGTHKGGDLPAISTRNGPAFSVKNKLTFNVTKKWTHLWRTRSEERGLPHHREKTCAKIFSQRRGKPSFFPSALTVDAVKKRAYLGRNKKQTHL
ncbi:hypothetical protein L218DRAFT_166374 [Marasmius fiardii PR-910]|nr:hypothetical protein L218DRAFT_166374 [Marasmius fiardii PR-910]